MWRNLDLYEKEMLDKIDSIGILFVKVARDVFMAFILLIGFNLLKYYNAHFGLYFAVLIPALLISFLTFRRIYKAQFNENREIAEVVCVDKKVTHTDRSGETKNFYRCWAGFIDENGERQMAYIKGYDNFDLIDIGEKFYVTRYKKHRKNEEYTGYPWHLGDCVRNTLTVDDVKKFINEKILNR